MANQEHLDILKQGREAWNQWRKEYTEIEPDLSELILQYLNLSGFNLSKVNFYGTVLQAANLSKANLSGATFFGADLADANCKGANFTKALLNFANLSGADFSEAILSEANLTGVFCNEADVGRYVMSNWQRGGTNFKGANLRGVNLTKAYLEDVDMSEADLTGAIFRGAILINMNLRKATLKNCSVYGVSVWDVYLEDAQQEDLIITPYPQSTITVDNLKIAQFIYLLLNNEEIRDVIDTITSKVVLILGRFEPERKVILDALRDELRKQNYSPILFDFEKPASRDLTEIVSILAHLARFIIVDLTDPSSAPHEVATIIPQTIVPVQPLLLRDEALPRYEYAMFHDLRTRYHWVLPTYQYKDIASLLASLKEHIIFPAEQKAQELERR